MTAPDMGVTSPDESPAALRDGLRAVEDLADPVERIKAAAALNRAATRRGKAARALRDNATVCAHLDFHVEPVVLYRDVLGVSRGLFNRMVQRANRHSPIRAIRKVEKSLGRKVSTAEDMCVVAGQAAHAVRVYDEVAEKARALRDDTGRAVMEANQMTNADFARATGVTTARAAQIRYGTDGHTPAMSA